MFYSYKNKEKKKKYKKITHFVYPPSPQKRKKKQNGKITLFTKNAKCITQNHS